MKKYDWYVLFNAFTAVLIGVTALLVILGWIFHRSALVQILPWFSLTVLAVLFIFFELRWRNNVIRLSESEQLNSGEYFRRILEAAPDAMAMIDKTSKIIFTNTQTEKLFGYTQQELLGKFLAELIPDRSKKTHEHAVNLSDTPSNKKRKTLFGLRRDGGQFPVEMSMRSLQTSTGLAAVVAIRDITKRKEIEQKLAEYTINLERSNRELEEFAYIASHDLKAPLRVIDNVSKWLEEDLQKYLTDETRENMNLLRGRVKRMEKLLDDLLQYSRAGHVMDERYNTIIPGNILMDDIVTLLALPEGMSLKMSPAFSSVYVNRMPLQQIFLNLISNAIKHHDTKKGIIEVTVKENKNDYVFSVKDDGPGIPAKFHEQIFKMFQTLKPKDEVEGSGMGLALVKKYIDIFGGTIHIADNPPKGSIFYFTWPKKQNLQEKLL